MRAPVLETFGVLLLLPSLFCSLVAQSLKEKAAAGVLLMMHLLHFSWASVMRRGCNLVLISIADNKFDENQQIMGIEWRTSSSRFYIDYRKSK
jgi:hypothetical protein